MLLVCQIDTYAFFGESEKCSVPVIPASAESTASVNKTDLFSVTDAEFQGNGIK